MIRIPPIAVSAEKAALHWLTRPRPLPPTIDLPIVRACVEACVRVYTDVTFSTPLAHCLVTSGTAETQGRDIIAFRGSADIRDWLTDFRVGFCYTPLGKLHRGFWDSASSLMPDLLKLYPAGHPSPLIITGHSKGAAESMICARRLAAEGRSIAAVLTFGGPRVGDAAWRKTYRAALANVAVKTQTGEVVPQTLGDITQRWVHEEDIVARLAAWCTGYRHTGSEAFMCAFGGVELNPPLWHKAASDLWGTFWGYRKGRLEQIVDHPVSHYRDHINSL